MERDFECDAAWAHYREASSSVDTGVGTYVAIADGAVIDWGTDEDQHLHRN